MVAMKLVVVLLALSASGHAKQNSLSVHAKLGLLRSLAKLGLSLAVLDHPIDKSSFKRGYAPFPDLSTYYAEYLMDVIKTLANKERNFPNQCSPFASQPKLMNNPLRFVASGLKQAVKDGTIERDAAINVFIRVLNVSINEDTICKSDEVMTFAADQGVIHEYINQTVADKLKRIIPPNNLVWNFTENSQHYAKHVMDVIEYLAISKDKIYNPLKAIAKRLVDALKEGKVSNDKAVKIFVWAIVRYKDNHSLFPSVSEKPMYTAVGEAWDAQIINYEDWHRLCQMDPQKKIRR